MKRKEMSKEGSKRRKNTVINKKELWGIFDSEINSSNIYDDIKNTTDSKKLECIYRASGNRDFCEYCESILAFSDEGFLTCTNKNCGIIYKDIVDHSAEWRYYGADDNQNSDPTRCGMPINPLLEESSYGCKVLCSGGMSYEMRKLDVIPNGNQCHTKKNPSMTNSNLSQSCHKMLVCLK